MDDERKDRLVSVGLFAAGLIHEVARPIGNLCNGLIQLERDLTKQRPLDVEKLAACRVEAGYLMKVATLFQKLIFGDLEIHTFRISSVVEEVLTLLRPGIGHVVSVEVDAVQDPLVRMNHSALAVTLITAIQNSFDQISRTGQMHETIWVRINASEVQGVIEIIDRAGGLGGDDEKKETGMGIGLEVVNNLLKTYGGKIQFSWGSQTEPTIVRIELPLEPTDAVAEVPPDITG